MLVCIHYLMYVTSYIHVALKMRLLLWAISIITFHLGTLILPTGACFSRNYGDEAHEPVVLMANDEPQTLTSPGYPNSYPPGMKCMWEVQALHFSAKIRITVLNMDLLRTVPRTCLHNVSLFDGSYRAVSRKSPDVFLCAQDKTVFFSNGREATIVFVTNELGSGRGFLLEYNQIATLEEKSDPVPIFVGVFGFLAVIMFVVCCYVFDRRRADRRSQRMPQPRALRSHYPRPPTRDLASPFLRNNSTTETNDTSGNARSTSNSRNTNNLPPTYQEVYVGPSPDTDRRSSAPPMALPPSYEDAVSKGMILGDRETTL
ncbi:uncharacterized protein LOC124135765 isoform X1 [Haliotis rufescens]|uniref:uncharacterized protein LOC124135765 isoform X1 n=1 Tax=Haliotis rufescens TaxID=6454 RepID=UPI00201F84E2|nr:uncharacterized protein LOC124135765 isoform X1 [Haliotis rufescens]